MPRQNPNLLSSASNLRSAAAAIRAAVGSGTFEDLKSALTAAAGAFEQAEGALSSIEQRLRDLGETNVNDPRRPAGVLVSGDRIRGGVQVQGGLRSLMGQGLDVTFETQVAHVKSYDHGADAYLELDLDGKPVSINSHGGQATFTGTPVVIKPGTDSTTAIQLENAAGTAVVTVDTTNGRLGVGVTPLNKFHVNVAVDENLHVRSAVDIVGAVVIQAVNDLNNTNTPMELRASSFGFRLGAVTVPSLVVSGTVATRRGTLTCVNGANNDLALPANTNVGITGPTGAFNITGFVAGTDGQQLLLWNPTGFGLTLRDQNAGSTAANRIFTTTGLDLNLGTFGFASLVYDSSSAFWVVMSHT